MRRAPFQGRRRRASATPRCLPPLPPLAAEPPLAPLPPVAEAAPEVDEAVPEVIEVEPLPVAAEAPVAAEDSAEAEDPVEDETPAETDTPAEAETMPEIPPGVDVETPPELVTLDAEPEVAPIDADEVEAAAATIRAGTEAETPPEMAPGAPAPVEPAPASKAAFGITIEQLNVEFTQDPSQADKAREGSTLQLSGVVESIGRDLLDNPYVKLMSPDAEGVLRVRCTGAGAPYEEKVAALTVGQTITVRGDYDGFLVNILLKDCVILS